MYLHHLVMASAGRMTLFDDEPMRRRALYGLHAITRRAWVLFSLVDDHVHLVLQGARNEVGQLAQRISVKLRYLTGRPLQRSHIVPVERRQHLGNLLPYLLRQAPHHGLDVHPALFGGSCFLDLVGARSLGLVGRWPERDSASSWGGTSARPFDSSTASVLPSQPSRAGCRASDLLLFRQLPRLGVRELYSLVDLPREPLIPDIAVFRELGLERLKSTVDAVVAYGGDRQRQPRVARVARWLTACVARAAGFPVAPIAETLQVSMRSVLRYAPVHDSLLLPAFTAVLRRLAIELEVEQLSQPPRSGI